VESAIPGRRASATRQTDGEGIPMLTILLIILIVLFLTGGGWGYSRRGRL
jgi:hypothetical protein